MENGRFTWCVVCMESDGFECATLPNMDEYIFQCEKKSYPYEKRGCFTKYNAGNDNQVLFNFIQFNKCERITLH